MCFALQEVVVETVLLLYWNLAGVCWDLHVKYKFVSQLCQKESRSCVQRLSGGEWLVLET